MTGVSGRSADAIRVQVKRPAECSDIEIEAFRQLVAAGGEVMIMGLEGRIRAAAFLSLVWLGEKLIGTAGLKHPSEHHRSEVEAGSGSTLDPRGVVYELGWVHVLAEHRGGRKSMLLCQPLVECIKEVSVFATSRANNPAMHRTLEKLGFVQQGKEWPSGMSSAKLRLFLRT